MRDRERPADHDRLIAFREEDPEREEYFDPAVAPGKRTRTMGLGDDIGAPQHMPGTTQVAPGKRSRTLTMTAPAPAPALQAKGDLDPAHDALAIAGQGIEGTGDKLPYLERIQASFGHHDVSGVTAHLGDRAKLAAGALGAEAYASGEHVAFATVPSLHTAAHEAAHVVQQRMGVRLAGGVGRAGDDYERQADRIADKVVAGESVARLLDGPGHVSSHSRDRAAPRANHHARAMASAFARTGARPAPGDRTALSTPRANVQLRRSNGVSVSGMRFSPREIPADGATKSQATVRYSARVAGEAKVNWSIVGPGHGASVSNTGLITPGVSVPAGKEKVRLEVKAQDSKQAGAYTTGRLTLWDKKYLQAKKDYPKFRARTPKRMNYTPTTWPGGKFDLVYSPRARRVTATVKLKLNFVNNGASNWSARHKRQWTRQFMSTVASRWSGQWQFENRREPKKIWGKLNPVRVRVRAVPVKAAGTQHITVTVNKKYPVNVGPVVNANNTGQLAWQDRRTQNNPFPNTKTDEHKKLKTLYNAVPNPIAFPAGKHAVPAGPRGKLAFLGTYLQSVRNPRFSLTFTGHAKKDPTAVTARDKRTASRTARRLAQKRARAVYDLVRPSASRGHRLVYRGRGDRGAAATAAWDKVTISSSVRGGYRNRYPIMAHEFGHMLGLDDYYPDPKGLPAAGGNPAWQVGKKTGDWALTKKALGKDYANTFARYVANSEAIMQGGSDVRPHHYITMWEGLCAATSAEAVPVPPFGQGDWKFVGF